MTFKKGKEAMNSSSKRFLWGLIVALLIFSSYPELFWPPLLSLASFRAGSRERGFAFCPAMVWAEPDLSPIPNEGEEPPPPPPQDGDNEGDGPIQRIFKTILHIINFPTQSLADTIDLLIGGYINGALRGFQEQVGELFAHTLLSAPNLEAEPFRSAWSSMRTVAMILWPMTLAIIAILGSHRTATSSAWGLADMKEEIAGWFLSVLFSFFSLYICNLFNRLALGMTEMIMGAGSGAELTVGRLASLLLTGWKFMEIVPKEGGILLALFLLAMALAVVLALAFQYIARYSVLFVLVALAPVAITLGMLWPLKWLRWMWIKGFICVTLIGPINALILKLIAAMGLATSGSGFLGTLAGFFITVGLASILIMLDGTIIKMVFAGAMAVVEQAKGSAVAVMGLLGATASIAAGFLPGAGATGGAVAFSSGRGVTPPPSGLPLTPLSGGGGFGSGSGASPARGTAEMVGGPWAAGMRSGEQLMGPESGGMRMKQALHHDAAAQQERRAAALRRAGRILRAAFRPGGLGALAGEGLIQAGGAMAPADTERASRAQPSSLAELQGMAARLGVSPSTPHGRAITAALAALEDRYRPEALRRAVGRALGPMAAARADHLPLEDMARDEGHSNVGSFVGGMVEDQIELNGEAMGRPRVFPRDTLPVLNPPHGVAPSWHDYKAGWLIAEAMGAPNTDQARAYAGLHHAFRDPHHGGIAAGRQLVQAAYEARERVGWGSVNMASLQQVRAGFARWVNDWQAQHHIPDSRLPRQWIRERDT